MLTPSGQSPHVNQLTTNLMAGVGGIGNAFSDSNEYVQVTANNQVIPDIGGAGISIGANTYGLNTANIESGSGSQTSTAVGRGGLAQGAYSLGAVNTITGRENSVVVGSGDTTNDYYLNGLTLGRNSVLNLTLGSVLGGTQSFSPDNATSPDMPSTEDADIQSLNAKIATLNGDSVSEGGTSSGAVSSGPSTASASYAGMLIPNDEYPLSTQQAPVYEIGTGAQSSPSGVLSNLGKSSSLWTIGIIAVVVFFIYKYLGKE